MYGSSLRKMSGATFQTVERSPTRLMVAPAKRTTSKCARFRLATISLSRGLLFQSSSGAFVWTTASFNAATSALYPSAFPKQVNPVRVLFSLSADASSRREEGDRLQRMNPTWSLTLENRIASASTFRTTASPFSPIFSFELFSSSHVKSELLQ